MPDIGMLIAQTVYKTQQCNLSKCLTRWVVFFYFFLHIELFTFRFFFFFLRQGLSSPDCSRAHYVNQASSELRAPATSSFKMLGLKEYASTSSCMVDFFLNWIVYVFTLQMLSPFPVLPSPIPACWIFFSPCPWHVGFLNE